MDSSFYIKFVSTLERNLKGHIFNKEANGREGRLGQEKYRLSFSCVNDREKTGTLDEGVMSQTD